MTRSGTMNLGLFLGTFGGHPGSWRHPRAPDLDAPVKLKHYAAFARAAEQALFDFLFIADVPATRDGNMNAVSRYPVYCAQLEPITLLSALASVTERIGLAATASTSFMEPYNLARQFASLDHLSSGRAAWNVVTTSAPAAALNFGLDTQQAHGHRYRRAKEFVDVAFGLWDSWEDDAFVHDRESGIFFDPGHLHRLDHKGPFFSVRGPLNVPRSPQGRPVIIQAGGSEPGKELAAETAEVVFTADPSLERTQIFYADLKGRMSRFQRDPSQLKILSQLTPIVAPTASEAEERYEYLQSLIHPEVGLEILSVDLGGVDLSDLPLDEPVPEGRIPTDTAGGKTYLDVIREMSRDGHVTLRQLYQLYSSSRGGNVVRGTPSQVADIMEEWYRNEAVDGFMVGTAFVPDDLKAVIDLLLPELQRRGLFRKAYSGITLRDHLGLLRPANRHALSTADEIAT